MIHRFFTSKAGRVIRSILAPALFFLVLMALDIGFRWIYGFAAPAGLADRNTILLFDAAWAGFLTALTMALPGKLRKAAMILLGLVFVILALVHGVLFQIFGHFFSFADMRFADEGAKFFSWSYFKLRKAFLLGLVLAVCGIVVSALLVPKSKWSPNRLLMLVLAGLCLLGAWAGHMKLMPEAKAMGWAVKYDLSNPSTIYGDFNDPNKCVHLVGLYQYTARDLYRFLGFETTGRSAEELDEYFAQRAEQLGGDTEMTGAFRDKNLIMVMMESMDTWFLTPEYMPNLWKVQEEGVNFANHYAPLYLTAGTFCTEFVSQTGLIPSGSQDASVYPSNEFPLSLAHLFRNLGYSANSFHAANPVIYSRGVIHQNLGFEAYHNYVDMGMDDYMLDSQMIRAFDQMVSDDPFFTFIITYSGHGPYTEDYSNISGPHIEKAKAAVAASGVTGDQDNMSQYTLAVAHAMETDAFIGELMEQLEASGHDEDTVVLFYTDHYGKYMTDKEFLAQVKGVSSASPELYRVPCILWAKGLEPQTVTKYTSTPDIAPTIVKLFGLDADCRYFVGDDMFGTEGNFVILPGYQYAAPEGEDPSQEVKRRLDASNDTVSGNYFASRNFN